MRTNLQNRFQYGVATSLVQVIGRLVHALPLKSGKRRILLQHRGSRHIVRAIDGAGFAAVYVATVAGKGDQAGHGMSPQF